MNRPNLYSATFDRCEVRGVVLVVVVCGVVLVVCSVVLFLSCVCVVLFLSCVCVCDLVLFLQKATARAG